MAASGWIIGVLLEDEEGVRREYFAVARSERAQAEWAAADLAITRGAVATSPANGSEPIEAVAELSAALVSRFGLRPREIRALGVRWPRRWLQEGSEREEGARKPPD